MNIFTFDERLIGLHNKSSLLHNIKESVNNIFSLIDENDKFKFKKTVGNVFYNEADYISALSAIKEIQEKISKAGLDTKRCWPEKELLTESQVREFVMSSNDSFKSILEKYKNTWTSKGRDLLIDNPIQDDYYSVSTYGHALESIKSKVLNNKKEKSEISKSALKISDKYANIKEEIILYEKAEVIVNNINDIIEYTRQYQKELSDNNKFSREIDYLIDLQNKYLKRIKDLQKSIDKYELFDIDSKLHNVSKNEENNVINSQKKDQEKFDKSGFPLGVSRKPRNNNESELRKEFEKRLREFAINELSSDSKFKNLSKEMQEELIEKKMELLISVIKYSSIERGVALFKDANPEMTEEELRSPSFINDYRILYTDEKMDFIKPYEELMEMYVRPKVNTAAKEYLKYRAKLVNKKDYMSFSEFIKKNKEFQDDYLTEAIIEEEAKENGIAL